MRETEKEIKLETEKREIYKAKEKIEGDIKRERQREI